MTSSFLFCSNRIHIGYICQAATDDNAPFYRQESLAVILTGTA